MVGRRFGNVREDASLDGYFVLEALACEPGKVDGCVYAYGFEACAGVTGRWKLGFVEDAQLIIVNSRSLGPW